MYLPNLNTALPMGHPQFPAAPAYLKPVGNVLPLPLLLEALPLLLLAQVNRTKDPDDDSKMGCKQFY